MPRMPIEDVRGALRVPMNYARYLRRDLTNFALDAFELADATEDPQAKKTATMNVLIGGADRDEVKWYRDVAVAAKLKIETMELSAVTVINAFLASNYAMCASEIVLLVDVGARSTNINILHQGRPVMTRIMRFGGEDIDSALGQAMSLAPAAAEQEKIKMTESSQALIRQTLEPLAREVRSSIDFVERQHELHVTRAFACGGSACSFTIVDFLSEDVGYQIEPWNPVATFDTAHFNGEGPKLIAQAPSLASAIGAAASDLLWVQS
jgi:type IV pilus assembly protein PilM